MTVVEHPAYAAARRIVKQRRTSEHEARHVAAAFLLGIPISEARADTPDEQVAGRVRMKLAERDLDDPGVLRKAALLVLVGPIGDPAWPPKYPPLSNPPYASSASDEAQLAAIVSRLGLDKKGWDALVTEAWQLAASREFDRIESVVAELLEGGPVLGEELLREIKAIVFKKEAATMEHLTMKATTVSTEEELGQFEAVISAWSEDREHDTIAPEAFTKTTEAWRASGKRLPLLHEHSTKAIGTIDPFSMHPTAQGLVAQGEVDRDTPEGLQTWKMIKNGSASFSIGFLAVKSRGRRGGGRHIEEIDLLEVSAVAKPAHAATRTLSWKSAKSSPSLFRPSADSRVKDLRQRREVEALAAELEAKRAREEKAARPIRIKTFSIE